MAKINLLEGRKIGDYRETDRIDEHVYDNTTKGAPKRGYLFRIPLIGTIAIGTIGAGFGISLIGDILGEPDYRQQAERHENKANSAFVTSAPSSKINVSKILKAVQTSKAEAQENEENGAYVYVGEIKNGNRPGEGEWPELQDNFYYEIGPKLHERNFKIGNKKNATIIKGMIMDQGFTIRASLQYINQNGEVIGGGSYEVPHYPKLDAVMNELADKIANDLYKITGTKRKSEGKKTKFASDVLHPEVKWQSTIVDGERIE
jgi:hypothetical protein